MEFIDTHNHLLPGVDDGSPDIETSIAMAGIAAADGIGVIVATPHVIEGMYDPAAIADLVADLQQRLYEQDIAVRLIMGAEVPMSICMSADEAQLRSLSIGGRYLLMESAETTFEQVSRAVYQVRLCGLSPVLAHPERTRYAQMDLDRLEEMVTHDDVYCQLTVASLEGLFGPSARKTCAAMARRGLAHLLASDAHSTGRRAPLLSAGHRELSRLAGEAVADAAVRDNPRRMIAGDDMLSPTPSSDGRAGTLRRLFGR